MMTMIQEFLVIALLYSFRVRSLEILPPCEMHADTYGDWYPSSDFNGTGNGDINWMTSHFYDSDPGEALNFTMIWLPHNCSYRRLDRLGIHEAVNKTIESIMKKNEITGVIRGRDSCENNLLEIVLIGDSALRGIICGIGRILSGSETVGPNSNAICGGIPGQGNPSSYRNQGKSISVDYDNLRITFIYAKSFYLKPIHINIDDVITNTSPYAVVVSTGCWDFDEIARQHSSNFSESCNTNETRTVSALRSSEYVNQVLIESAVKAIEYDVRLIYRNNHHNRRFGTLCADEKFERLLNGTMWELFDNRRISYNASFEQNHDGFHFDRTKIFSVADHISSRLHCISKGWETMGTMETQFAQSLLNLLFFNFL